MRERASMMKGLRLAVLLAAIVPVAAPPARALAEAPGQNPRRTYKPGERVECDPTSMSSYMKGTVVPFQPGDPQGDEYVRVKIDDWPSYPNGVICQTKNVRPVSGAAAPRPADPREPQAGPSDPPPARDAREPAPAGGPKFRPGDRVECDLLGNGTYEPGTVLAYLPKDTPGADFYIHRVRMDSDARRRPEGGFCFTERMRRATGPAAVPPAVDPRAGEVVIGADGTVSPKSPVLACPIQQPPARNGQRPDPELLKRLIRCHKGEKPAARGSEGAVVVEVREVQVGAPRPWAYHLDRGSGTVDTLVHPVKATYDVKTHYRTVTEVEEGWVRILNAYVDSLGEWRIGSEEPVRAGTSRSFARTP